jgi:AraC-like DNA-binding protein
MNPGAGQLDSDQFASRKKAALHLKTSGAGCRSDVNVVGRDFGAEHQRSAEATTSGNRAIFNHRLIERLAASALFREYRQAFQDATRLPLTLRAAESWQLAHADSPHQNGFCALMSQASRSCAACLQVQQRVCEGVNGVPCTMSCTFGLRETAVGVKVGHETIAYLQTGQVFFKPPTARQTQRALRRIRRWGLSLDKAEAARRYNETRVVDRSEYEATVRLLQFFADQLGPLADQLVIRQQTAEPAQITRARKFIDERHQEEISLTATARQAGMSTFHFCKRFKQALGMSFTQYLSRVRVEKAKKLLLNFNYRVSEIAFESGFQSVPHFNRVFRRVAGESPTEFRQCLTSAECAGPLDGCASR